MKNKKGFTLIELLAVIVVLAILLVIAIPKVMSIINTSRAGGWDNIVKSVEQSIELSVNTKDANTGRYKYTISGICNNETNTIKDITQTIRTISNSKYVDTYCKKDSYYVFTLNGTDEYDGQSAAIKCTSKGVCDVDLTGADVIVKDKPCELAVDKKDSNILYIDSVEDMYAFSNSVNSGNSYSGKTIKLRSDLNFRNYSKTTKPTVCSKDDNKNGFTPIGTFYGVFEGGTKTIYNLDISLSNKDNVGLFSINRGTIRGLNFVSAHIYGHSYVGLVAGLNYGNISSIFMDRVTVNGSSNASFVSKNSGSGASHNNILIISGTTSGDIGGNDYNGYLVGDVTGQSGSYPQYYSNRTKINGATNTSGFSIDELYDINFLENYKMDTWIGGDNNGDGYYFDYESNDINNKKIVLKSTAVDKMTFDLSGSGTKKDPYIIKRIKDWKTATLRLDGKYYFKLQNDLSFSNNKFYVFGSKKNQFNGIFDGGAHTIRDVTVNLPTASSIGIFGYLYGWKSGGYIYGLNIEHIRITGKELIGGLVGEASGPVKIYEISLNGVDVTSTINSNRTGIIAGYSGGSSGLSSDAGTSSFKNILIKSGNSTGSTISTTSYTGTSSILVESARVNRKEGVQYYSNQLIVNGTAASPSPSDFTQDKINDLLYYKGKIDTRYDNDGNNTGYYFAYDSKRNGVYLVKVGEESGDTNKINPTDVTALGTTKIIKISDTGKYKLEVWGAQGGSTKSSNTVTSTGGYGAYSVGYINLNANDVLYVTVGGVGESSEAGVSKTLTGGYNGGGNAYMRGTSGTSVGSGGGATHIALSTGLLSKLSDKKDKILIVAAGGGGGHTDTDGNGYNTIGGNAGGYKGNPITQISGSCSSSCTTYNYPSGGTQSNGGIGVTSWTSGVTSSTDFVGTFGQGATGTSSYGGGGGGYFGGASGQYSGGGGGSSYISPSLTNAAMYCYNCAQSDYPATKTISNNLVSKNPEPFNSKIGAGYARITYISE